MVCSLQSVHKGKDNYNLLCWYDQYFYYAAPESSSSVS
jgi:hypothetical protein